MISLAIGDPTTSGCLAAPLEAARAVAAAALRGDANGYAHSAGMPTARSALAAHHTLPGRPPLSAADVVLTSGCSQALEFALASLAGPGSNVLLPRPGFPLYATLCDLLGVESRYYDLTPDDDGDWAPEPTQLARLADAATAAVVVTNPGNPTGHVLSRAQLGDLVRTCEHLKLPIISDEVYGGMVFDALARPFIPTAALATTAPVLAVSSLSKRFLVPGWRTGWLVMHDPLGLLGPSGVRTALSKLAQVSLGPCTLIQAALPEILGAVPPTFFESANAALGAAAARCVDAAGSLRWAIRVAGTPRGAMYLMLRLIPGALNLDAGNLESNHGLGGAVDAGGPDAGDGGSSEREPECVRFCRLLAVESAVALLPGSCFGAPGCVRLQFAASPAVLDDAWARIGAFCARRRRLLN